MKATPDVIPPHTQYPQNSNDRLFCSVCYKPKSNCHPTDIHKQLATQQTDQMKRSSPVSIELSVIGLYVSMYLPPSLLQYIYLLHVQFSSVP